MPGASLTLLGRAQADSIVEALANVPIEAVYASTQHRSQQTAAPLAAARGLPLKVRDGIREVEAGVFEMRSDEASIAAYQATFTSWASGSLHTSNPGGETGHEAFARFNHVIAEAASMGSNTVALISHGAMLRSWAGYYCQNLDAQYVEANPPEHRHHRSDRERPLRLDSRKLNRSGHHRSAHRRRSQRTSGRGARTRLLAFLGGQSLNVCLEF